jgi:hypothetical protein
MKKLVCSIGFTEIVFVSAIGKAGGICMLWSNSIDVNVVEFDSRTVAVKIGDSVCSWTLIGF